MSPTFTRGRQDRVYRYYVSTPLLQGVKDPLKEGLKRVPAGPVEDLVRGCLERLSRGRVSDIPKEGARVDVLEGRLCITTPFNLLLAHPADPQADLDVLKARLGPGEHIRGTEGEGSVSLTVPCRFLTKGGRVWITDAQGKASARSGSVDQTLIKGLRLGHQFLARTTCSALGRPEQAMLDMAPSDPYHRKLFRLAYLAPDIQTMILEGRQPETLSLQTLVTAALPAAWDDQRRLFGIGG